MIDAAFVQKIVDLAPTQKIDIDGRPYSSRPVYNPPLPEEPRVATMEIATLSGLVAYCKFRAEHDDPSEDQALIIHVEDPWTVHLASSLFGLRLQRHCYVTAKHDQDAAFRFDDFMSHGRFVIALQTKFTADGDRDKVLRVVGTIKDEHIKVSLDDGFTQKVTASSGLTLVQEIALPNPVSLQPFRTFHEIDQPASLFVLRVQAGKPGCQPDCALFEADGGSWKREAIAQIAAYLQNALPDITVIA